MGFGKVKGGIHSTKINSNIETNPKTTMTKFKYFHYSKDLFPIPTRLEKLE